MPSLRKLKRRAREAVTSKLLFAIADGPRDGVEITFFPRVQRGRAAVELTAMEADLLADSLSRRRIR